MLLATCARAKTQDLGPDVSFAEASPTLAPSTITDLTELESLPPLADNGAAIGLHFSSDTGVLQVVYETAGTLVRWDIRNRTVLSQYILGISTPESLRFDTSGSMLLGATTSDRSPPDEAEATRYLSSVAIWETLTGRLAYCVARPCEERPTDDTTGGYPSLTIGADMDRAGTWAIDYSPLAISFDDLRGDVPGQTAILDEVDRAQRIANVALDPTGARYAVALRQGPLTIRRRWVGPFASLFTLELAGDGSEVASVPDLRFSNDGTYLATVRGETLLVWTLGLLSGRLIIREQTPKASLVEFGATDELVAVATSDSILIFDLSTGSLAKSINAQGITSMTFDVANRFLVWGDSQGGVHLMQIDVGPT